MSNTGSNPNNPSPRLVLTSGEPAGIGPDIVLALCQESLPAVISVIADPEILRQRASALGLQFTLTEYDPEKPHQVHTPGEVNIIPLNAANNVTPGKLDLANADYVTGCIKQACLACLKGKFDAMITAPVNKAVINDAGTPFSGHTEFIAELCKVDDPVMMLMTKHLRVALVTTHLPLAAVSAHITAKRVTHVIETVHDELIKKFSLRPPRILVCGLNPHAGEGGHLGHEERDVLIPALDHLRNKDLDIIGPVPADTAFTPGSLENIDTVVCMYHDQGLPVLKAQGFGAVVNLTLGIPVIRTSVDHGTALALAASGKANHDSLRAATFCAIDLATRFSYR